MGAKKNRWKETCEAILGKRTRQHKEWNSEDPIQKKEERKRRKTAVNDSGTRAAKAESQTLYSEVNKAVKRSVKQDKNNFVEDLEQQKLPGRRISTFLLLSTFSLRRSGLQRRSPRTGNMAT